MDERIRRHLEAELGLALDSVPDAGPCFRPSPKRTSEPGNRLLILRMAGRQSVVVTGTPFVLSAVRPVVESMTACELFSPLGTAELNRAMGRIGYDSPAASCGFVYALSDPRDLRPAQTAHAPLPLTRKDIPAGQLDLRMRQRRRPVAEDFIWAFACYHDDPDAEATELTPFGPQCASIAIIIWRHGTDVASFGVGTEQAFRGQGYALACVSAATRWVLEQGAVARYGADADNAASLRIPRRLGFTLLCQDIRA
jgi:RimJ/RimL family protein N-acetyltransferase